MASRKYCLLKTTRSRFSMSSRARSFGFPCSSSNHSCVGGVQSRRTCLARYYLARAGVSPSLTASHGEFPTPRLKKNRSKSPVSTIPPLTRPCRSGCRLTSAETLASSATCWFPVAAGYDVSKRAVFLNLAYYIHYFLHLIGSQTQNEVANHLEIFDLQTPSLARTASSSAG